jgi:pantoate--beta-alanine ligase
MRVERSVPGLRAALAGWREQHETVALVPTMGALHRGHLSLIAAARAQCRRAVATLFVNPLQFGANEDFARYPRGEAADRALLERAGCDLLYAPGSEQMYPPGFATSIAVGEIASRWEGEHRPGHFAGVATVVAKLLLQALPDAALFGEKDYQQLLVIERMVRDLDIPVRIVGCPTVREPDGLALSSRNVHLSAAERTAAPALHRALQAIAAAPGAAAVAAAIAEGTRALLAAGFSGVDYLALVDAATLAPVTDRSRPARAIGAARLGAVRLIDNLAAPPA